MAYPIQTLSDGRIKYSDGSIRGTAKYALPSNTGKTVSQNLFQQGAKTSVKPSVFGQPVTVMPSGQNFNTPSEQVMNTPVTSLTADILRSKFGFNDQNVINTILNDPSQRSRYENELNPSPSQPTQPTGQEQSVRKSFADILTENANIFTQPKPTTTPIITNSPTSMESGKLVTNFDVNNSGFQELWSKIRGTAGDFVDSMAYAIPGSDKRKDTGFSEWLAGRATPHTIQAAEEGGTVDQTGFTTAGSQNQLKSKATNFAVGSDAYPVQTLSDGRVRYSDGSIKGNMSGNSFADLISKNNTTPEYKLGNAEKTATDILSGKENTGDGVFALIDPNIEDQIKKQAETLYNNGASEAEVAAFIQKTAEEALDTEYNRLNTEADLNIPKYERYAQESIDEIGTNQKEIEDLGAEKTSEANNTYAEKLLQSQLSKRGDETRLRNLFSTLGTAESSAFIENMSRNSSDYGKFDTELGTANIKTVGDIDKEVVKAKTSASKQIESITKDKNEKIAAVEANKSLYGKEKYTEKQKILAEYKVNMQSIYQDISDKTTSLQNLKLEFMMGQSNINQNGQISSDLLDKEYALQNKTSTDINSKIPPELDTELTGFSINPQSSSANNQKRDQLKMLFPGFSELIDSVYNGTANYNTVKASYGLA